MSKKVSSESYVKDIRRKTRKKYSSEEKIRIVLEGLRGEDIHNIIQGFLLSKPYPRKKQPNCFLLPNN